MVCGRNSRRGSGVTSGTVLQYVIVLFSRLRILLGTCNHECHNLGSVGSRASSKINGRTRRPRSTSRNLFFEHLRSCHAHDVHLVGPGRQQQLEHGRQLARPGRTNDPGHRRGVQQRHAATMQRHLQSLRQVDHDLGQQLHAQRQQTPPERQRHGRSRRPASALLSTCNSPRRPPSRSTTSPT